MLGEEKGLEANELSFELITSITIHINHKLLIDLILLLNSCSYLILGTQERICKQGSALVSREPVGHETSDGIERA